MPQREDSIAGETLAFLDSLCFHVDGQAMERWDYLSHGFNSRFNAPCRLEPLARHRETLMVLLHPSQTSWFLERSSRLLLLLSTCKLSRDIRQQLTLYSVDHELYKVLLDIPDGGNLNGDVQMKDALFERLCSHLIDTDKPPSSVRLHLIIWQGILTLSVLPDLQSLHIDLFWATFYITLWSARRSWSLIRFDTISRVIYLTTHFAVMGR